METPARRVTVSGDSFIYMREPNDKALSLPRLNGCGYIETVTNEDGSKNYVRCDILTSKKVKLNGQLVPMCETHRKMHESKQQA